MRLWTLHPKYLDAKGLIAVWREALLAQAVLLGQTKGYLHHPQLIRFRRTPAPCAAIAAYLRGVESEASQRGYCFDLARISSSGDAGPIDATEGQLQFEWDHLRRKLGVRSPEWLEKLAGVSFPEPHPLFRIIPGPVEAWEVQSLATGRR